MLAWRGRVSPSRTAPGKRLTLLQTAADTRGLSFVFVLGPGGGVPVAHVSPMDRWRRTATNLRPYAILNLDKG